MQKNSTFIIGLSVLIMVLLAGIPQVVAQDFSAKALDPSKRKITQAYILQYEEKGERKSVAFEHGVANVEYTGGKFTLEDPDKTVLTSWKAGDKQLTVTFKEIQHRTGQGGTVTNILTFAGDDGSEFQFIMSPRSSMIHGLSPSKGDILRYLKKKAERPKDKR